MHDVISLLDATSYDNANFRDIVQYKINPWVHLYMLYAERIVHNICPHVRSDWTHGYMYNVYSASTVKQRLNIFLEKTMTLSKNEFIIVTFMELDKVVTIYSKF